MTTPTQVLSDEQIYALWTQHGKGKMYWTRTFARAIEAAVLASIAPTPDAVQDDSVADGELIADLIEENRTLQARLAAQPSVVPEGFDEWMANPYTKTLVTSIGSDYVPKYNAPAQPCGEDAAPQPAQPAQPAQPQVALDYNSRGILSDALGMYARKHGMAPSQRQAIELMLDRLAAR